MKLKDIFDNMKGEWDWFGHGGKDGYSWEEMQNISKRWKIGLNQVYYSDEDLNVFSLADLLSNQSWAKCVWGERLNTKHFQKKGLEISQETLDSTVVPLKRAWNYHGIEAFSILQQSGEEECLKYIHKTMLK